MLQRLYQVVYDAAERILPAQADHPATNEQLPIAAINKRSVQTPNNGPLASVGDMAVAPRGHTELIWSSEGYTTLGNTTVPALTASQKFASGTNATNATSSPSLDVSSYQYLTLIVNLASFSGTSIAYEYDMVDSAASANSYALWKPAVITVSAATIYVTNIGPALGTAPTAPSGSTYTNIPFALGMNGIFKWTATALTAASWVAFLYGTY